MSTDPEDRGGRPGGEETSWSWDNVPQVSRTPADQPPPAYGQRAEGGYAPIPVGGGYAEVQPGIVPLRPLNFGEFFDGGFRAIRFNPAVMLGVAAIVIFGTLAVQVALTLTLGSTLEEAIAGIETGEFAGTDAQFTRLFGLAAGAGIISFVASTILTGMLIQCVTQSILGRKVSLAQVWAQARGQVLRLIGLTLLIALFVFAIATGIILIIVALFVAVVATSIEGSASDGTVLAVVGLAIVGGLIVLAAVAWAAVKTLLATPILMAERTTVFAAFARSFRLSRGHFWRIAGIYVLSVLLVGIMTGIVSSLFSSVGLFVVTQGGGFTNDLQAATTSSLISGIITSLLQLVFTPFLAAVTTLIYTDVRMRTEGLDLALQRAAAKG